MSRISSDELTAFLEVLGMDEPLGMAYADAPPEEASHPAHCPLPTRQEEAAGTVDWRRIWGEWSCVFRHLHATRRKGQPAWFGPSNYGCLGAAFYLGWQPEQLEAVVRYVSTGGHGMPGERYADSPETLREMFRQTAPRPAPRPYAVFRRLSDFTREEPEVVVFFGRPECIAGLHQLAVFATGDLHVVASPFGAGCANMVTWPLHFKERGQQRAVLGGWDISVRKYMGVDEITFSLTTELFERMLGCWRNSFLTTHQWAQVAVKRRRSREAWARDKA
ncbi:DUF169 domain-containing protein [Desulfocurvibacter africanus]|uniref:DUF169 domain-containing protein n=1 Tax=Desulfocurvibacter africanus subsp. africanus str. Walvis Bay TaxID=690850 RepID=F3Z3L2_DESAF|nr:DUF169 domain-containing protein [Desulfocurvibacter africanus]EGJ50384.1 protein of unknown function DUF169 [Desulfocurvibacter africanus subsp. africanus str. Walvis Bay]